MISQLTLTERFCSSGKPLTAGPHNLTTDIACGITLIGHHASHSPHRSTQTLPGVIGVVLPATVKIREDTIEEQRRMGGGAHAPLKSEEPAKNEAPEYGILECSILKCAQGLSPRSSASLNLRMQSSTPCAILANSRDSTFFSRYSISSSGKVTFKDFFRVRPDINNKESWSILNTTNNFCYITHKMCVGLSKNGRKTTNSGRYAPEREETRISLKAELGDRLHGSIGRIQAGGEDHYGGLGESLRCGGRGSADGLRRDHVEDLGDRAIITGVTA